MRVENEVQKHGVANDKQMGQLYNQCTVFWLSIGNGVHLSGSGSQYD